MLVFPNGLRACAAAVLTVGLLALGFGCKGKNSASSDATATLSGSVTYLRAPLVVGADGKPTAIQDQVSQYVSLPARGVKLRVMQAVDELATDGTTKITAWVLRGETATDSAGNYSIKIPKGYPTFVELYSAFLQPGGHGSLVEIIADPAGIDSTVPEPSRQVYAMRKGVDGTTSATNPTPGTAFNGDTSLNFAVGANDPWLVTQPLWFFPSTAKFTMPSSVNAGSRILAIIDSIWTFANIYGDPTPNTAKGGMDLHYYPGLSHSRGTFVEYDLTKYPLSFDGGALRYFGSISGGGAGADDAFNEGILFPILARNCLFGVGLEFFKPTGATPGSLVADLAMVDGFPDAMAATLLQTPWLCDPAQPTRFPARDIRDLTGVPRNAYSPRALAALAWELTLKAHSITSPGTRTDWGRIDPTSLRRFFTFTQPTVTSGTATVISDLVNINAQLSRLQESKASSETLNLLAVFPDSVLSPITAPFGVIWAGSSALPTYTLAWGTDPNTAVTPLPVLNLSMAGAELVRGVYPNCSNGEVAFAKIALTLDRAFNVSFVCNPPLPAGVKVELVVNGDVASPFLFDGTAANTRLINLAGNYGDTTTPKWHYFRVRLLSPNAKLPDTVVTVNLAKAN